MYGQVGRFHSLDTEYPVMNGGHLVHRYVPEPADRRSPAYVDVLPSSASGPARHRRHAPPPPPAPPHPGLQYGYPSAGEHVGYGPAPGGCRVRLAAPPPPSAYYPAVPSPAEPARLPYVLWAQQNPHKCKVRFICRHDPVSESYRRAKEKAEVSSLGRMHEAAAAGPEERCVRHPAKCCGGRPAGGSPAATHRTNVGVQTDAMAANSRSKAKGRSRQAAKGQQPGAGGQLAAAPRQQRSRAEQLPPPPPPAPVKACASVKAGEKGKAAAAQNVKDKPKKVEKTREDIAREKARTRWALLR